MEIYEASPKAFQKAKLNLSLEIFEKLEIGKCYIFNFVDVKESYLRNRTSIVGKKLNRSFKVIKHKNSQIYEVARVK